MDAILKLESLKTDTKTLIRNLNSNRKNNYPM